MLGEVGGWGGVSLISMCDITKGSLPALGGDDHILYVNTWQACTAACDAEAVSCVGSVNSSRFRYLSIHLGNLQVDVQGKTEEMFIFNSQIISPSVGVAGRCKCSP